MLNIEQFSHCQLSITFQRPAAAMTRHNSFCRDDHRLLPAAAGNDHPHGDRELLAAMMMPTMTMLMLIMMVALSPTI